MTAPIFNLDLARDIRDDYVDYLSDGLSATEATLKLTQDYPTLATQSENTSLFWQALAAIQSQYGDVLDLVKRQLSRHQREAEHA